MPTTQTSALERALDELRKGEPVTIEHGERALLVAPAALATEDILRMFEASTTAPAALALDAETFDELGLGVDEFEPSPDSPVGKPIDVGVSGIDAMSRRARAHTIAQVGQGLVGGLLTPGHTPTVRSSPGNLLSRVGLVEAAIDLVVCAGFRSAAIIAFLVDDELKPDDCARVQLTEIRSAALGSAGGVSSEDVSSLFVAGMSRLVAPVAVVTSSTAAGEPQGLIISSLTSYSAVPPSVVFSVGLSTRSYASLHGSDRFGVHILAQGQDELVGTFSSRSNHKFALVDWRMENGVPRIDGVQTMLHCHKIGELRLGDHALFVGAIVGGESGERDPMVYFDRRCDWRLAR